MAKARGRGRALAPILLIESSQIVREGEAVSRPDRFFVLLGAGVVFLVGAVMTVGMLWRAPTPVRRGPVAAYSPPAQAMPSVAVVAGEDDEGESPAAPGQRTGASESVDKAEDGEVGEDLPAEPVKDDDWRWSVDHSKVASSASTSSPGQDVASAAPDAEAAEEDVVTVYATKSGTKFHASGCKYLVKSSIPMSRSEAVGEGLSPCSVCNP